MRFKPRRVWMCGVVLATLASCQCEKKDVAFSAMIPKDAIGVMTVKDLSKLLVNLDGMVKRFSTGPAATFIAQGKIQLAQQIGFDPLSLPEWTKLGVNPEKGLAVAFHPTPTLLLAIKDAKLFEGEIQRVLKQQGLDQLTTSQHDGLTVTHLGVVQGGERVQYLIHGGYALVTGPFGDGSALSRLAKLPAEQSVQKATWFTELSKRAPKTADVLLLFDGARMSQLLGLVASAPLTLTKEGGFIGLSLSPTGIILDSFLGSEKAKAQKNFELTSTVPAAQLERYLPGDTMLAFKLRLNPVKLLEIVFASQPEVKVSYQKAMDQAKAIVGGDIEKATLQNFTGNAVMGLGLTNLAQPISQLMKKAQSPKFDDALRAHLWLQVKDGKALTKVVEQALTASKPNTPLRKSTVGSLSVLQFDSPEGVRVNLLWPLKQNDLLGVCLGATCVEDAQGRFEEKKPDLSKQMSAEARKLFDEAGLLLGYLHVGRIVEKLEKLDAAAFGEGGMMVKLILDAAIGPLKNLKELTTLVRLQPDGMVLQGDLRFQ